MERLRETEREQAVGGGGGGGGVMKPVNLCM